MAEDETKARFVAGKLAERRWKQADLVRETGLDKNTISDFVSGKRQPSLPTMQKVEDALGLTRGTLAALGEEDAPPTVKPAKRGAMDMWTIEASAPLGATGRVSARFVYEPGDQDVLPFNAAAQAFSDLASDMLRAWGVRERQLVEPEHEVGRPDAEKSDEPGHTGLVEITEPPLRLGRADPPPQPESDLQSRPAGRRPGRP